MNKLIATTLGIYNEASKIE